MDFVAWMAKAVWRRQVPGWGRVIDRVERADVHGHELAAHEPAGDCPVTIKGNGSTVPDTPTSPAHDIVNAVVGQDRPQTSVRIFSNQVADGIVFAAT
jgi:hypothetical protein